MAFPAHQRFTFTGLATYSDVTVVCGEQKADPDDPKGNTLINPSLIVEVLSPSTEDYDRGEKLAHYKKLADGRPWTSRCCRT
ncbi:MAG: Uma2 family endonuclease [Thermoanaerobaculia bacterium]